MKKILLLFVSFFSLNICAQTMPFDLQESETKLSSLFDSLKTPSSSKEKLIQISLQIEKELSLALKSSDSFDYPFDLVQFLGKIYSDDKQLRIYTWNVPFADGTFTYGCIIQQKQGNVQTVLKLKDAPYKPSLEKTISPNNWYGALYYRAITVNYKKQTYYVLLGWAGNNDLTNFKMIDALSFDSKQKATLGLPVFKKDGKSFSRIIFEYGDQNNMSLDYDKKTKQLIFDHLSPSSSKYEGIYTDYGPDFTYDSFQQKKQDWIFKQNIDARNKE